MLSLPSYPAEPGRSPQRDGPNATDFFVTSLSPILIMTLIGSLVFFLVEILYAGKYEGRLLWTLFFFVCGIVLVGRIAIQVDAARAKAYGLGLSAVSWFALMAFIEYPADSGMAPYAPVINMVLMGVVWWCASKLVWDCTFIDENRSSSSKGLLAAAGMESTGAGAEPTEPVPQKLRGGFWEGYARYRDRRAKRPHTPGVTVLYFSLAALPIFGLGQSLIPSDESSRRSFTFILAACYVGSALGLLLTTSFLGLRRYLRQRGVRMPGAMTGTWLGMGAVLIALFLIVAALLPRPYSETPIWGLGRLRSSDRDASKHAVLRGGEAGKGEGRRGDQQAPGDGDAVGKQGNAAGKGNIEGKQGDNHRQRGKNNSDGENKDQSGANEDADEKGSVGKPKENNPREGGDASGEKSAERSSNSSDGERRFPETRLGEMLEKVAGFVKWLVFVLLALAVLGILFRWGLQYFANFTQWARNWLAMLNQFLERLWGRRKAGAAASIEVKPPPKARRPFHSFTNPFADGSAEVWPVEELIQYSFAALCAWANDRNHPRGLHETALEFASRLTTLFPSLGSEAHRLAVLTARSAYAQGTIGRDALPALEQFWDRVTALMPETAPA